MGCVTFRSLCILCPKTLAYQAERSYTIHVTEREKLIVVKLTDDVSLICPISVTYNIMENKYKNIYVCCF
jgi:hypothetical protein